MNDRRQAKLVDRDHLRRNETERGGKCATLEEGVDAEACLTRYEVGEVELEVGFQSPPLVGREDRVDELARVVGRQRRVAGDRLERTTLAQRRRGARRQMEIGRASCHNLEEDF